MLLGFKSITEAELLDMLNTGGCQLPDNYNPYLTPIILNYFSPTQSRQRVDNGGIECVTAGCFTQF